MRGITTLLVFLVLRVSGCSEKNSPEAIIRVRLVGGDTTLDRYDLMTAQEIMRSFRTVEPVAKDFHLAEKWGLSEVLAMKRLHQCIQIRAGAEPGLLVVQLRGIENEQAAAVLNALCQVAANDKHVIEARQAGNAKVMQKELSLEVV